MQFFGKCTDWLSVLILSFMIRTLAQLQAIESIKFLRETYLNFKNAKVDHPVARVLEPWVSRFTKSDICKLFYDLKLRCKFRKL